MIPKELAYKTIEDLVTRFDEQLASYKKADYNEAQTRKDFIFIKKILPNTHCGVKSKSEYVRYLYILLHSPNED